MSMIPMFDEALTTHLLVEWSCAGAATVEAAKVARRMDASNFILTDWKI